MTVAKTIAQQIGNQALTMIGAKRFVDAGNGLIFKVGRNSKSVNTIKIILNDSDTYTMSAYSIRGITIKPKGELSGLYFDQLNAGIESLTNMYTKL